MVRQMQSRLAHCHVIAAASHGARTQTSIDSDIKSIIKWWNKSQC